MNNRFPFAPGFGAIKLLVAAAVIYWVFNSWRTQPDGKIARLVRHRDRIWFALLLIFVPVIGLRFLVFHLFPGHLAGEPRSALRTLGMIFALLYGAIYGLAACWFVSPAKAGERFSYPMAIIVAAVLMIVNTGLSMVMGSIRFAPGIDGQMVVAATVIVAFALWRLFAKINPEPAPSRAIADESAKKERNPMFAVMWLLIGLAPIPVMLIFASSNTPKSSLFPAILVIGAVCNLCGGLGCLAQIKNSGTRIILGIFLGIFFLLFSWLVAVFVACSHSGGI